MAQDGRFRLPLVVLTICSLLASSVPVSAVEPLPTAPPEGAAATTVQFRFFNQTWSSVLQSVAQQSGSTLVMDRAPRGRYTGFAKGEQSRTAAVRILNNELEPLNFRVLERGQFLVVLQLKELRTQYARPEMAPNQPPHRAPHQPHVTANQPVQPLPEWNVHDVATRERTVGRPEARPIQQVAHETKTLPEETQRSTPGPLKQFEVRMRHRAPVDVAKMIYNPLKSRAQLVDSGQRGLPAFRVTLPGRTDSFTMAIDDQQRRLLIEAPADQAELLEKIVTQLDSPAGNEMQIQNASAETLRTAREVAQMLPRLRAGSERAKAVQLAQNQPNGVQPGTAQPGERPALPDPRTVPPGQAPTNPLPPGINPDQPLDLQAIIDNMRGDVTVESLSDLGVLILRGNEKDVEAVMQIIKQLEKLSAGINADIHLLNLRYVNSEALAVLLNEVYEQLGELRNRTPQAARKRVVVIPVVNPNAVLILAPEVDMESIRGLADELDQPVDPQSEVTVVRLKNAVASQVVTSITDLFTQRPGLAPKVLAVADVRTNSLIVQARPRDLAEVLKVIRKIDMDSSGAVSRMRIFELKNAVAEELAETINAAVQSVINAPTTGGQGGFNTGGAGGAQQLRDAKSAVLEFLRVEDGKSKKLRSGLLADIRVNADPRTNSLLVSAPEASMPLMAELIEQLDRASSTVAEIKVFSLANADATNMSELLQTLFAPADQDGPQGVNVVGAEDVSSSLVPLRFSVDPRTNSIIAVGGGEALLVVEAILLKLDAADGRARKPEVYRLRNAPAETVATAVNAYLDSQRNLAQLDPNLVSTIELLEREIIVVPDTISNSLIVSVTPRFRDEIFRIIEELDRTPEQVVIQAMLVEVELNHNDEFGVELGFQDMTLFDRGLTTAEDLFTISQTNTSPNGVQTTTQQIISQASQPGFPFNNQPLGNNISANPSDLAAQSLSNFALGRVNSDLGYGGLVLSASSATVNVLIRALAARRNVHILSRPQIRTLDNQNAQIEVGQLVPRVNGVTVTDNFANPNVIDTQVGIILSVTPRISPTGDIVMEVEAIKSALSGQGVPIFTDVATGNVTTTPIIDNTRALASVSVPDGQTIVLGGMITKSDDTLQRKVPWLGDIPLLGNLFRYDATDTRRTELLIFLTPRIVRNEADSELIKQVETERLHFLEQEVEAIHGPIYSVPARLNGPDAMLQGMPNGEYCPPGMSPQSGQPQYGPAPMNGIPSMNGNNYEQNGGAGQFIPPQPGGAPTQAPYPDPVPVPGPVPANNGQPNNGQPEFDNTPTTIMPGAAWQSSGRGGNIVQASATAPAPVKKRSPFRWLGF